MPRCNFSGRSVSYGRLTSTVTDRPNTAAETHCSNYWIRLLSNMPTRQRITCSTNCLAPNQGCIMTSHRRLCIV